MLEPARTAALFADARLLYDEAIELLDLGKLRIAAEAAWGATKRATDALIVARTGREPSVTGQTSRRLSFLRKTDAAVESLRFHYIARQGFLHGQCFYRGIPESYDDRVIAAIRETADYISNAEALAGILDRG